MAKIKHTGKYGASAIPIEEVRELLDYDPETGVLKWRERGPGSHGLNRRLLEREAGCVRCTGPNGYKVRTIWVRLSCGSKTFPAHRLVWMMVNGPIPGGRPPAADRKISSERRKGGAGANWHLRHARRSRCGTKAMGAREWLS